MTPARRFDELEPRLLSEVAAAQIVWHRRQAKLTHAKLAALCSKLGWPALTASAISNIETGRRDKDGKRRREITLDELVIIARALEVPPILLVAPLGYEDAVEIFPGYEVRTLDAYEYLSGGYVVPNAEFDEFGLEVESSDTVAPVVRTYRDYEAAIGRWWRANNQQDEDEKRRSWDRLQALQRTMQEQGWRIPPLPGETPGGHWK